VRGLMPAAAEQPPATDRRPAAVKAASARAAVAHPTDAAAKGETRMGAVSLSALVAAFISSVLTTASAASNPCEPEILRASDRYGVPAGILYAVGLTETGRKGTLQPNALNIEGKTYFPASRAEAVSLVEKARGEGRKLIDLGCMQINHHYHSEQFSGIDDMLDPHRNVDYAARFLVDLHKRHASWSMAVARYHAGPDNDPAQKRYICRVVANMVATGFGRWTPEARAFCN
jgi:soluble lytic murein transglycosylase-like protein